MPNKITLHRVIAIDPGFGRMGVAVLEKIKNREVLLYSSCIVTDAKSEKSERLGVIKKELEKVLSDFEPDAMAIESLFFTKNIKTGLGVAEARGVALAEASVKNISVFEYKPVEVKMAVTGFGASDKRQITYMVKKLVGLGAEKRLDDEYDAIAVGLTHLAVHKYL
jgi:crossover junction endodeoxyribonuclease RuvC